MSNLTVRKVIRKLSEKDTDPQMIKTVGALPPPAFLPYRSPNSRGGLIGRSGCGGGGRGFRISAQRP